MSFVTDNIVFDELSVDPAAPEEGQVWYRTDLDLFSGFANGTVFRFTTDAQLTAHINDLANPHQTTLELARVAANVLAGPIDMGNNLIQNVATAVALTDAPNLGQVIDRINNALQGLDWQESILDKDLTTPPGSPVIGDRYGVAFGGGTATGAWTGQENNIAEWDGAAWVFTVPDNGTYVPVEDEGTIYVFDGASWSPFGLVMDHGALTGLLDDDHPQYHTDARALIWLGTRSTDDLPEGALNLYYTEARVSANVDVAANTAHRLIVAGNPHGTTKADIGLSNVQNILNNFAGSGPPTVGDDSTAGYSIGSEWFDVVTPGKYVCVSPAVGAAVWLRTDNAAAVAIERKAGTVASATFALSSGRQKATVSFATPFPDTTYSVVISTVTTNNRRFAPIVENKTTTQFTINLGTSNKNNLVEATWIAVAAGELA